VESFRILMCLGEREAGREKREAGIRKIEGTSGASLVCGDRRALPCISGRRPLRGMCKMMQMNVPQLSQGYPSDARSSLLQDRQIIASRSRRIWRIKAI